jgi:hypothetical protein
LVVVVMMMMILRTIIHLPDHDDNRYGSAAYDATTIVVVMYADVVSDYVPVVPVLW